MRLPFLANLIVTINHSGSMDRHSFEKKYINSINGFVVQPSSVSPLDSSCGPGLESLAVDTIGSDVVYQVDKPGSRMHINWSSMIKEEIQQRSEARPFGTHDACHH
ncbi:hypothetical protein HanRHA438_Chr12g0572711 [Helianthus annuus]|nr:hypothetical protein HanIR_Chr12g0606211 [Helianthus annuus]KAJ0868266.1 hypothetical protein HanRHA438_Chr12g0572711 [Helianthus annuus]